VISYLRILGLLALVLAVRLLWQGRGERDRSCGNLQGIPGKRPHGKPSWVSVGSIEPHMPHAQENCKQLPRYGATLDTITVPEYLPDSEQMGAPANGGTSR